ncbi:cytochrome P450 [Coccidioides immitis RMSCC 3703]|uniref:Cytochrome P450 n=1 Tax=Coccidioides immitis RMSCC 3703 TaxID=454286 RepID=A0A0J8RCG2_COCIT|nr:cytochrome P450 [Coccidioides immitis RMSCC 3703]
MHEKYGPIVRISPHELHINDPEYYDVLYSRDSPRDKYSYYTGQFGTPMAAISTISHAHHRLRRSNMNPYFSMARIRKLEPAIQILVDKLCNRLKEFKGTGVPIVVQYPYTCFSTDVISDYTMGTGFHYLDEPDFIPHWSETLSAIAKATVFFKPYPWLLYWLKALPEGLVGRVDPGMNLFFVFQRRCKVLINSVIREHSEPDYEEKRKSYDHPTFFHDILDSNLPPEEKGPERLAQEIQGVIGAGSETVAKTLTWLTYYLLENKDKMDKLLEELNRLDPDRTATVVDLEKMPYLTSVMLEALRISYGVSSRLQRICPDRDLQYKEWSIPAGTPVGMTSVMMHHNEDIFPDSYNFVPERWLDPDRRKYLERYLVAFSKGSRQCVGIKLGSIKLMREFPEPRITGSIEAQTQMSQQHNRGTAGCRGDRGLSAVPEDRPAAHRADSHHLSYRRAAPTRVDWRGGSFIMPASTTTFICPNPAFILAAACHEGIHSKRHGNRTMDTLSLYRPGR